MAWNTSHLHDFGVRPWPLSRDSGLWKSFVPRRGALAEKSKVFRSCAKATRSRVPWMRVGNALRMACQLLLLRADEVARNGAFRKILRPEVFPDAPLQFRLFAAHSLCSLAALLQGAHRLT